MTPDPNGLRRLLPRLPDALDWEPETRGESASHVFRSSDSSRFAKVSAREHRADLVAERDRIDWLAETPIPCPRVLDWIERPSGQVLVTNAVPGVPADVLSPTELATHWPVLTGALADLHRLPGAECPFERRLSTMLDLARDVVRRNAVQTAFLSPAQCAVGPERLMTGLEKAQAVRTDEEAADLVVCHGDACLPNLLVHDGRFAGFVDLGRLGLADRHADLTLLLATADSCWPTSESAADARESLAETYGRTPDPVRLRYYLDLDPLTW